MKTRVLFPGYPRKISLLNDLRRQISRAPFCLGTGLKQEATGNTSCKTSLIKDLADRPLEGSSRHCRRVRIGARTLQIVKELEELTAVIEQLMLFLSCYPDRNIRSRQINRHDRYRHPPLAKTARSGTPGDMRHA